MFERSILDREPNSIFSEKKSITTIKPKHNEMFDLQVLCSKCTKFKDELAIDKVYMKYNMRDELFRCEQCDQVVSERQMRKIAKLELPEYTYIDNSKPIEDLLAERESNERFIVEPIIRDSPFKKLKRKSIAKIK